MADIFGGVEPPAWLTRATQQKPGQLGQIIGELVGGFATSAEVAIDKAKTKTAQGEDTSWIKELPGSIQTGFFEARMSLQDPMWRQQAQQAQLNMAQQGLAIKNQQSLIEMRGQKMRMQEHDQDVLPKWLQDHPTWESRQDAEPPVLFTPEGEKMFGQLRMNDASSTKAKAVQGAIHSFSTVIGKLQALNGTVAASLYNKLKPGQVPTPELQAEAETELGKAQEAAETKKRTAQSVLDPVTGLPRPDLGVIIDNKVVTPKAPPKPPAPPKLPPGLSSEVTFGREQVLAIEKDLRTLNPANAGDQDKITVLNGRLEAARKFYNRKVKEANEFGKTPATAAPGAAAPVTNPKDSLGLF